MHIESLETKKTKIRTQNEISAARAKIKKEIKENLIQQIEAHAPGDNLKAKLSKKLYTYKLTAEYKAAHTRYTPQDVIMVSVFNSLASKYYNQHRAEKLKTELSTDITNSNTPHKGCPRVLPFGITYNAKANLYAAKITVKSTALILGEYSTLVEARAARNAALRTLRAAYRNPARLERALAKILLQIEVNALI